MGDVITLPVVRIERLDDGGKARIRRRRERIRDLNEPITPDDLVMDHADNGMPCDSAYTAPEHDPA